ncbi:GNAT family N-acetyltransferase [Smaragdicoccus niigatensis]|uniref:GNAT family N-acetyltransferase n=1 Tax=Smaragdicoccus niigatensis TaxID=359359 RepID=UPI000477263F|nr:GNAT family N-acetyltransferase [Smaragdicoccus niigatensis]
MAEIDISTDLERIDRDWLWTELSERAYWAKYRTREMFDRQLDQAWRIVGAYDRDSGAMVGFARSFSDGAAVAYLADVYVNPACRGRGVGSAIVRAMIDDGPGSDFRWMLHTADAHSLYARFGFGPPDSTFLQRDFRFPHIRD